MKLFASFSLVGALPNDVETGFSHFQTTFGKKYGADELEMRRAIFIENLQYRTEFNSDPKNKVRLDVGPFADLREEEFKSFVSRGGSKNGKARSPWGELEHLGTFQHDSNVSTPTSINWVKDGGVTEVKNQGMCGSCWSFSTTGALEGQHFATSRELVDLSEQNLLDCDGIDKGCNGGIMDVAFTYVQKHGLCTERSYPYACSDESSTECRTSQCHTDCDVAIQPHVLAGFKDIRHNTLSLMQAVIAGPVSVAIEADSKVFQHYSGGVLTNRLCGESLDHGVLCVGYGVESDDGTEYWLVKNSWGSRWGMEGYIKIGRGYAPENLGECGILEMASFPIFRSPNGTALEEIVA